MEVIQGPICKVYDLTPELQINRGGLPPKNRQISGFLVDQCGSLEEQTF